MKNKDFSNDFRLVSVWKHTDCFSKYSFREFKDIIGDPSKSIIDPIRQIHHYNFNNNDKSFSQCTIEVINDSIVRNYCLDNVKITKVGIK